MLLADVDTLAAPEFADRDAVTSYLDERGVAYTTWQGWEQLDAHEVALGEAEGRSRVKVVPRDEMVKIARG